MKSREFHKRLRQLGAVMVRTTGGHAQWRAASGAPFTTAVPGRSKSVTPMEIRDAAHAIGVSAREIRS